MPGRCRHAVQGDDSYLGRGPKAERNESAYAGRNIESTAPGLVETEVLMVVQLGGTQAEQGNLAAMHMAAQGELYTLAGPDFRGLYCADL